MSYAPGTSSIAAEATELDLSAVASAKAEAVVDDLRDLPRRSPAKAGIVALVEREEGVVK